MRDCARANLANVPSSPGEVRALQITVNRKKLGLLCFVTNVLACGVLFDIHKNQIGKSGETLRVLVCLGARFRQVP